MDHVKKLNRQGEQSHPRLVVDRLVDIEEGYVGCRLKYDWSFYHNMLLSKDKFIGRFFGEK